MRAGAPVIGEWSPKGNTHPTTISKLRILPRSVAMVEQSTIQQAQSQPWVLGINSKHLNYLISLPAQFLRILTAGVTTLMKKCIRQKIFDCRLKTLRPNLEVTIIKIKIVFSEIFFKIVFNINISGVRTFSMLYLYLVNILHHHFYLFGSNQF